MYLFFRSRITFLASRKMVVISAITHVAFFPVIRLFFTDSQLHGVYRIFGFDSTSKMFFDAGALANFTKCLMAYSTQICYESNDTYPYSMLSALIGFFYLNSWMWIPILLQLVVLYQLYELLNRLDVDIKIFTLIVFSPSFMMLYERGNVDQLSLIVMFLLANNYTNKLRFFTGSILTLIKATNIGFIIFLNRFLLSLTFAVGLVLASYSFNLSQILSLWSRRSPLPYGSFGMSIFPSGILLLSSLLVMYTIFRPLFVRRKNIFNLAIVGNKDFWLLNIFFYSLTYLSGPNVLYHFALFIPFFILVYKYLILQNQQFADLFVFCVATLLVFSSIRFLVTTAILFFCLSIASEVAKQKLNSFVGMIRSRKI